MKFFALPHQKRFPWLLCVLCVLCGSALPAFTLDRESFTITNYDLNVQVEPEQHRLGVRGKITLRNDSPTPQKIAVLQISSSLDWRSIKVIENGEGKPVQFVTQPYTSDIDHTGALSEAIVTLPHPVPAKETIDLEIGYEGVIVLDATRLTRNGTPQDVATSSDWDQVSTDFTGVRGAGYVAWYPIATEAAELSESNSLFEVVGRWKAREAGARVRLSISSSRNDGERPQVPIVNERVCAVASEAMSRAQQVTVNCAYQPLGSRVPSFLMADYGSVDRPQIVVYNLAAHAVAAESYAQTAQKIVPLVAEWFGAPREKAQTADLPYPDSAPFESGSLLLIPLTNTDPKLAGLASAHQLTHAAFFSPRPWINEGLAHLAQALYLEQRGGRQAALDYMGLHRSAFVEAEKPAGLSGSLNQTDRTLVNTTNEELYRSKAMCVWWMLRDMIGDAALKKALAAYHSEQDDDPSYMPRLISAQTQRDLQWFFDDWVYHDRGLPDFKVESVFPLKTTTESYLVTVTVTNSGTAGAEVPVIVKFAGGDVLKRVEVRAESKGVIRVEVPKYPQEVVVNDGSVPESDLTNNTFRVPPAETAK